MSNGLSDNLKATGNRVKGEVKEALGKATNDPKLQAEGKYDKAKGKMQDKIGDAKEHLSSRLDRDKDRH